MGFVVLAYIAGVISGLLIGLVLLTFMTRRIDRAMGHDDGTPPVLYPKPRP